MDYIIYQVNMNGVKDGYPNLMFMGYDFFSNFFEKTPFNMTNLGYQNVYTGKLENDDVNTNIEICLHKIFEIFNIRHPEDYKGRSLSVSDIVFIDGNYYYCDSFGWTKLDNIEN